MQLTNPRMSKMTLNYMLNRNLWHLGGKITQGVQSDISLSLVTDDILMLIRKRNNNFPIRRRFCLFAKQKRSDTFIIGRRFYKFEKSDFLFCRWFYKRVESDIFPICRQYFDSSSKTSDNCKWFFGLAKRSEWSTFNLCSLQETWT